MKISERGQITVPKNLRNKFGLHKDVEVDLSKKSICQSYETTSQQA